MTLKVREVLDIIDGVLAQDEEDARELWDILTALRGPDDGSVRKKDSTTVHIRAAAFPKTASSYFTHATMNPHNPLDLTPGTQLNDWHFDGHVRSAAVALGLISKEDEE